MDPSKMSSSDAFKAMQENPDMMKMAMDMMKSNPDMLKNMAKSMGPNNPAASFLEKASPNDMERIVGLLTGLMKVVTFCKKNKYFLIAILILCIAYFFL